MLCVFVSRGLIFFSVVVLSCLPVFVVRGFTESNTSTAHCAWLPGSPLNALHRPVSPFIAHSKSFSPLTSGETLL